MTPKYFDFTEDNGLVFCQKIEKAKNNAETLYLYEAQKLGIEAIFFRRFYRENNPKPYHSEPAVCIFQKDDDFFNTPGHIDLHASLWSAGKNEVYIINGKTRVDVINARKPAEPIEGNKLSIENLVLETGDAIQVYNNDRFSSYLFGSGTFWDQAEYRNQLKENISPYIFLLEHLMAARRKILKPKGIQLEPSTIDKLLVTFILIKFLEEIKDDNGKHTLREIYKKYKIKNFVEALEKGLCIPILDELSNEFNGKIFDKFSADEKNKIQDQDLGLLADFLRADVNIETRQLFIWQQYDFKYLPAEVISAIYENFIQAEAIRQNDNPEKSIVYTPIHLVNFLVDEAMPLNEPHLFKNGSFRVLDPACGSGVFLVAAYRRLLQWWTIRNSSPSKIQYPSKQVAQRILEENIFGVDVKETSVLVSIFGLTLAFLDKLTPKEIWDNLKFRDLSQANILKDNFFNWATAAKKEKKSFDLVIGNPPFNLESGKKKEEVINKEVITQLDFKHKDIPSNNFALHFLEGSMLFAKKVCLILPSNILLYTKSETAQKYRSDIFTDYTVDHIYDFTHLRRILFHADTPVAAIVIENKPSEKQSIPHTVIKRTMSAEQNSGFEIDYYDRHYVRWNWATDESKQFVWKTNLLGGGQLFHLIYRLSLLRNLEQFINEMKEINSEWVYSVGYKLKGSKLKENIDYIFGKESINTATFNEKEEFTTFIETNKDFAEPRDRKIYESPHLIFKVNLGHKHIPVHYSEKYLCFKDKLIGLHAPASQKDALKNIYTTLIDKEYSKLSKLWILSSSAETLINLETTCKKEDIDSLPYPENKEYLLLSKTEKILQDDVLQYYIHLGKSITEDGKILHEPVEENNLIEFANTFCEALNAIYEKNGKSLQLGIICQRPNYIVCQFGFGKNDGLEYEYIDERNRRSDGANSLFSGSDKLDEQVDSLTKDSISNSGAIYNKIIRFYKHIDGYDCIFLVKPNAHYYWLKSIALRDAGDTYIDLKKEGF